ncbi:MAG: hypothetical protein C5B55_11760 [Blastocatellia bacterium]|nr:MAG: hypothetical protein C5B55_11760 [Blastocatellia bacterium]
MKIRKLHRLIGLALSIPFLCWAVTGLVFFIKPGYASAYEQLTPKTYPLTESLSLTPDPAWNEIRLVRTVLGDHLLVRTKEGWLHLDPKTRVAKPKPNDSEIRVLLKDAFSANPSRYGDIASINGDTVKTTTGVQVRLDWSTLSLQQMGPDTERIDRLYRVHYLQWTGVKNVDKVVGFVGLTCVMALTVLGVVLAFKRTA